MTIPRYALNHQEVDERFQRTSEKERRIKKLRIMIKSDLNRINKLTLKLETDRLELKILNDLLENPTILTSKA